MQVYIFNTLRPSNKLFV